tara:strand:- start:364 stop:549 length:186 start_codon:yes stop_codon:yes gene_type:complete
MGSLFSKPKRAPAIPPPAAIPDTDSRTGDFAQRKAKGKKGFRKSILTGALTPTSGKNQVLG